MAALIGKLTEIKPRFIRVSLQQSPRSEAQRNNSLHYSRAVSTAVISRRSAARSTSITTLSPTAAARSRFE